MADTDVAGASEPVYFVSLFDPTGVMMTAVKIGEHLSEEQAVVLRDQVFARGGLALVYRERPDQIDYQASKGPLEAGPANAKPEPGQGPVGRPDPAPAPRGR